MPIINEEGEVIQHYGVLGMKWGVRRNRSQARAARGYAQAAKKLGLKQLAREQAAAAAGHERAANKTQARIDKKLKEKDENWEAKLKAQNEKNKVIVDDIMKETKAYYKARNKPYPKEKEAHDRAEMEKILLTDISKAKKNREAVRSVLNAVEQGALWWVTP